MTIPLASITFGERISRAYSGYTGIEDLADSIRDRGLIQPLVLNQVADGTDPSGSRFILAAGGRRFKALEMLGIDELTEGLTSVPGCAGYVKASDLPDDQLLEVELEENLFRMDMDWRDRAIMVHKIHSIKSKMALGTENKWGQRQTGQLLGVSLGDVNNCLTVAKAILMGNEPIKGCTSVRDAIQLLIKQRTDDAQRRLVQSSIPHVSPMMGTGLVPDLSQFFGGDEGERPQLEPLVHTVNTTAAGPVQVVKLRQQLMLGDCLTVMKKIGDKSFDHIISDPPYGIDMENLDLANQSRIEDTHDVQENLTLLEAMMPELYRVLKDDAFCILCCDINHFQTLKTWAEGAGFKSQSWPLVWHKEHPCRNQAPTFNFTKNYELALVLRKGLATLQKPQTTSVITCDGSVERKLYDNPFAKPFEMWRFFLEAVASKGQTILDPCMGEGSCLRACVNLGLIPYGIELEEHHYNRALENIKNTYSTLLQDGVKFE